MPAPSICALSAALSHSLRDAGVVVQIALFRPSRWFALSVSKGDGGILITIVPAFIYLLCEKQIKIHTVAQTITKAKLRSCFSEVLQVFFQLVYVIVDLWGKNDDLSYACKNMLRTVQ